MGIDTISYLIFIDANTQYTWLYPLKLKSKALATFIRFHKLAELQYNTKLKSFQSDNGGEFEVFLPYFQQHGILPRLSCPHTHQQNGVPKRIDRHIAEMGLTCSCLNALKILGRSFSSCSFSYQSITFFGFKVSSPFELLYHKQPDYSSLQPFGLLVFLT